MDIEISELPGGVTCLRLKGRLDAAGADRVGVRFTAASVSVGRPTVVDLSGVDFVASMGLRLLISAAKGLRSKNSGLVLFGAQPMVLEVLEQSAIDQIVPVVGSQDEAVASLAA